MGHGKVLKPTTLIKSGAVALAIAGACVVAPAVDAQVFDGQRVALVVGNSRYVDVGGLVNPRNDAIAIANALRALDFDVIEKVDVDRETFFDALHDFSASLRPGVLAVFYYAGHGVQVDGRNYILPIDARLSVNEDFDLHAVNASDVLGIMEASGAGLSVMILDACRDNPFPQWSNRVNSGLAAMEAGSGQTLIAYATAPGNVADDGNGVHSPYTQALLQVVREPGLEIGLIFRKVRRLVREATNGAQIPWVSGTLEDQFYLTPPNVTPDAAATDVIAWQSVQQIEDTASRADALRHYLDRYPDGRFAMLALLQLRDLIGTSDYAGVTEPDGGTLPRAVTTDELVQIEADLSGDERRRIQEALLLVDAYYGEIDGMFGRGTRQAIRRFQERLGQDQSGYLTDPQRLALAVAAADQAAQRSFGVAEQARAAREKALEVAASVAAVSGNFSDGAYTGQPLAQDGVSYGVLGLESGDLFTGEFEHGQAVLGVRAFTNGDIYMGAFRDGLPQGFGVYQFSSGGEVAGQWHQGVVDGFALSHDATNRRIAGEWHHNRPHGFGVASLSDGTIARGFWIEGEFSRTL